MKFLVALLAGIAMPFAFAPYSFWLIPFASIAILFGLLKSVTTKQAWNLGLVFGLGYFIFGVYWIYHSVRLFGEAPAALAVAMTLLFVLIMALFPALVCAIYTKIRAEQRFALVNALTFSGIWVIAELMRGWIFGGFPWLLVGYTQIDSVFSSYAPILGVFAISWQVVFIGCGLCVLLTVKRRVTRTLTALCLMLLAVGAAVLSPIIWTQEKNENLDLRLVQGNIKQELKFSRERLDESLRTYQKLSQSAPQNTQLVIWPETAIPTLFDNVEKRIEPFIDQMTQRGVEILSGGFYRDENDNAYNSVRQLGGDKALYAKGHLVPFGEFMPFRPLLEPIAQFVQIPMSDLSAAPAPARALSVGPWQLGISICYEDVFGVEMRSTLPAASLLINVSNDAWFGDSAAPHQHQEMARMRAREFERAMVRVTNTGVSSIIDFRGSVQKSIPFGEQGVLDASIPLRIGATPYVTLGNVPVWVLSMLCLLSGFTLRYRQTTRHLRHSHL